MDRIITDNSKVNENLLNEVKALKKQNKELIVENIGLKEQLRIGGVGNSYGVNENDINDYGEYMFADVGLGNFPEIDFEEWFKSEELQKRRKNYY